MPTTYNRFQEKLVEQRKNPETARAGLKWSSDEDTTLLDDIKDGVSIEDIAKKLQRTAGSIKTRLIIKALVYLNENEDDAETSKASVVESYGITEKDLDDYQEKKKQREQQRTTNVGYKRSYSQNRNTVVSLSTIYALLQEINNKLG